MMDTQHLFLLVLVLIAGLYMAWNIGANDVANAMGTSVGSGALLLKQAVILSAIFEFVGAFFFGSRVSETIQRGIINSEVFAHTPMLIAYGMLASLLAAGVWLQIASYFGWPVATTHSIIGAIVGFGLVAGGWEAIYWENMSFIVFSWVLSPFCGALISFTIFTFLRKHIFYSNNPIAATKKLTPFIVFVVTGFLSIVLIYHGLENVDTNLTLAQSLGMSFAIGCACAGVSYFCVRYIKESTSESEYTVVEKIFAYLQIMSACMMAFAHGANDVSNAIGPLTAAISVITTGEIATQNIVPTWALALGGLGIVVGLATWGWRVIETIGKKITELTPSRGFAAEFGAAITVVLASRLGLPISTTHTLVGAVIGVGLAGGIGALNLSMTRDILIAWLVTVPAGAGLAILFFYGIQWIF